MTVRELGAGDGQAVRRLWDDLGGWYRNTSPASDADVDRALGRILRQVSGGRRPRRGAPAEAAWVALSGSSIVAWLYARAEPEQNYVVPLIAPEDPTGSLADLLGSARTWFLAQEARRFVLDVPEGRTDLQRVAEDSGRRLWHRQVLDRDLSGLAPTSAAPSIVREFRRSDLAAAQSLFGARHPEKLPTPIPVAFLDLRTGWFREATTDVQRGIWVAAEKKELLGVAGSTHRPGAATGFLGPWVLAERSTPVMAEDLLSSLIAWLRSAGAHRVRTTTPVPLNSDARALLPLGFHSMAESDLYELRA